MIDLSGVDVFGEFCRMTRAGGSDDDPGSSQCPCDGPRCCLVKHLDGYDAARRRARVRLAATRQSAADSAAISNNDTVLDARDSEDGQ